MKKILLFTVLLSLLAFACTDNPLFKISFDIPYNTNYTIKASDQVNNQLVIESDEESYDVFLNTVQEQLNAHGIEGDFEADVMFIELTIPDEAELDWSVLGNVSIDFSVNGEPSTLLDEVTFEGGNFKTMKVGLPPGGISITDFLSFERASIKIVADLEQILQEDIRLDVATEVKVSGADEK